MIKLVTSTASLFSHKVPAYAWFVEQDFANNAQVGEFSNYYPEFKALCDMRSFTGKTGSSLSIPFVHEGKPAYVLILGLGKKDSKKLIDIEAYRRMVGRMVRMAEELKISSLAVQLPDHALFDVSVEYLAEQTTTIVHMAHYHFDAFITDKERKIAKDLAVTLVGASADHEEVKKGVARGEIMATAVNKARYWIDTPPSKLTPGDLAKQAEDIAKAHHLPITIFSEAEIIKMGMGGLSAVSKGSDLDCKLVIMEYKSGKKDAPTLALVGKGITFDSGGLSIKPAASMETMKEDMSGAAAVVASMEVIAQLKPDINVIALAPISENLPSGKATKPGDIATFYNGKTAEIKNTDAEGRLILADALSYAVKHYKPDAIIDIATLTGACAYAVGPFFCGMMSQHEELVDKVVAASQKSGDRVWRLPLHDDYKTAIKSTIADICNIGSSRYRAGATTAAQFLQNFVGDVPWLHLDIASTAFDVPDISYFRPESATGFGIRLMVEVACNWHK
jgi:leucyl aminopeptidase